MEENDFTLEKITPKEEEKRNKGIIIGGLFLALGLGILSGFVIHQWQEGEKGFSSSKEKTMREVVGKKVKKGEVYGRDDKIFKDSAVGVIEKNGIDGEGTHRLLREGGESQTAYLTSSVLDLDLFIGHKVKVWGQTFAAEKAGWLMDVGKVEVLE